MPPCRLKARRFSLSVLEITDPDPQQLAEELRRIVADGGSFLCRAPVVLDLRAVELSSAALEGIPALVGEAGLVPCGVICSDGFHRRMGEALGLAQLQQHERPAPSAQNATPSTTRLVDGQVRSGQQVYARDADLVVVGSVSNGAEIVADGSIHVYGTLRGRAIAGAAGREDARIFARTFRAELVAIAGHYRTFEERPAPAEEGPVQVRLTGDQLAVTGLDGNP